MHGDRQRAQRGASGLVAEVMRHRRALDAELDVLVSGTLEPALRCLLRLALHEATRGLTPDYALVHAYVGLTKNLLHPGAGKLVNASPSSPRVPSAADEVAAAYSLPTWMVERWVARMGLEESAALASALSIAPTHGLRLDVSSELRTGVLAALESAGAVMHPAQHLPDEFVTVRSGMHAVVRSTALAGGQVAVQDEAAGAVVALLDPRPGEHVLDACAAPGGKAMHVAARMGGRGRLLAADASMGRLALVQGAATARGLAPPFFTTRCADVDHLADEPKLRASFHRVLLDVPCTGTGVLARKPDIRWRRRPEDVAKMAAVQRGMLLAAAALVAPGGTLVYSTCSLELEENGDNVAWFLASKGGAAFNAAPLDAVRQLLPATLLTPEGYLTTWPHRHGTDGAFAAKLERSA